MAKIWFRVGMEAVVSDEELKALKSGSSCETDELMKTIIARAKLSGETYILGKDSGGVDNYDNPNEAIDFLF